MDGRREKAEKKRGTSPVTSSRGGSSVVKPSEPCPRNDRKVAPKRVEGNAGGIREILIMKGTATKVGSEEILARCALGWLHGGKIGEEEVKSLIPVAKKPSSNCQKKSEGKGRTNFSKKDKES